MVDYIAVNIGHAIKNSRHRIYSYLTKQKISPVRVSLLSQPRRRGWTTISTLARSIALSPTMSFDNTSKRSCFTINDRATVSHGDGCLPIIRREIKDRRESNRYSIYECLRHSPFLVIGRKPQSFSPLATMTAISPFSRASNKVCVLAKDTSANS